MRVATTGIRRVLRAATPRWMLIVLILAGFGTTTAVTLLHSQALSPLDEWVYVDYLDKVPTQGMVFKGEPIGHHALDVIACHGVLGADIHADPCGSQYDYRDFPFGGITSADPYPPVFFAITRGVGDAIAWVSGVDDLTAWRLVGSLWLVGGLIAFWALLRAWRVDKFAILALGLVFIGSPLSFWTYSFVSTDAPAFLLGALLLYFCTRYLRGEVRGWWIVAIAAIGASMKITNILGVGMVALVLLIAAVARARDAQWSFRGNPARLAGTAGLALVASIAVQGGWLLVDNLTAVSSQISDQSAVAQPLTLLELLTQVVNFLPGTIVSNVSGGAGTFVLPYPGYAMVLATWLCMAGVLVGVLRLKTIRGNRAALVIGVFVAALLAAPALAIAMRVLLSSYFTLPSRYGASLLPGFLLLAGMLFRNRWIAGLIAAYGVVLCVALIYCSHLLGRV